MPKKKSKELPRYTIFGKKKSKESESVTVIPEVITMHRNVKTGKFDRKTTESGIIRTETNVKKETKQVLTIVGLLLFFGIGAIIYILNEPLIMVSYLSIIIILCVYLIYRTIKKPSKKVTTEEEKKEERQKPFTINIKESNVKRKESPLTIARRIRNMWLLGGLGFLIIFLSIGQIMLFVLAWIIWGIVLYWAYK